MRTSVRSPAGPSLGLRGNGQAGQHDCYSMALGEGMPRGCLVGNQGTHLLVVSAMRAVVTGTAPCQLLERGKSLEGPPGEQAPSSSGEPGRKVESSELSLESSESGSGLGRDSGGIGWKRWTPLGLLM